MGGRCFPVQDSMVFTTKLFDTWNWRRDTFCLAIAQARPLRLYEYMSYGQTSKVIRVYELWPDL